MPERFASGDLVKLRCGGPIMVIDKPLHSAGSSHVNCKWFVNDMLQSGNFEKTSLIEIDDTGGKFEIYKDKTGKHRFRLKANNNEIIAASEAYSSKQACKKGIQAIQRIAANAEVVEI